MNKYWVWLSCLYKIGTKSQNELLKKYKTPEAVWNLSREELKQNTFLEQNQIENILNELYRKKLDEYIEYMKKNQISMITINDENYPSKLREIYDPPVTLFVKGNKKLLEQKSIAVIGSRNCSEYGKLVAENFAYKLVQNNIIVISGLARGIDSYAHLGALKESNSTIAVTRMRTRSSLPKRKQSDF